MKKSIKNIIALTLTLSLGLSITGCKSSDKDKAKNDKTITIGVSVEPHKPIVENAIKPILEEEGYKVKVVEFTDYVLPNTALSEGDLDANYFQHVPYLESTVAKSGYDLTYTAKVHLEPMGIYSQKITDLAALKDGAEIAIPNDATNGARALKILADNGLIEVPKSDLITVKDISKNPKNFKFVEMDAQQLPRLLQDVDIAVINTNYALEGGLNPLTDALALESKESPYANIIAVRTEDKDSEKIKALTKAATSDKVRKYLEDTYKGAIVPAF